MLESILGIARCCARTAMMGRQCGDQTSLFYEFRLDDRIPTDHLLRRIDVFVTPILVDLRGQLQAYYSDRPIRRPRVDDAHAHPWILLWAPF